MRSAIASAASAHAPAAPTSSPHAILGSQIPPRVGAIGRLLVLLPAPLLRRPCCGPSCGPCCGPCCRCCVPRPSSRALVAAPADSRGVGVVSSGCWSCEGGGITNGPSNGRGGTGGGRDGACRSEGGEADSGRAGQTGPAPLLRRRRRVEVEHLEGALAPLFEVVRAFATPLCPPPTPSPEEPFIARVASTRAR